MALNIKNKIRLGTVFLFFLLLLTGGVGIYFMAKIKGESKAVLQANYESLSYCHTMLQQLSNLETQYGTAVAAFDKALDKQAGNVTEQGEGRATDAVKTYFNKLKGGDTTRQTMQALQSEIQNILSLNMKAIEQKNSRARQTADKALGYIITLAGLVFLISFTFIVNFPSIVTNPVGKLTEGIQQIADKNYKHRIRLTNKDEFGNLADAFNNMAERMEYFESSNLNKLMFEKSRAEAVINSLKDASIGIDKNNSVLFANFQALQLLGLPAADMVGKPVGEISGKNDLFRFLMENETSSPFKIVVDNKENYFVKETIEVAQGNANNKVVVIKNITLFKELDQAKTNFIATISHELKTPLASSDFSLKLLEDPRTGTLTDEQKELVHNLKGDNIRMLKILSELLNMSQVEAGRIQLNIAKVKPDDVISDAIHAVAGNAKEKNVTIKNLAAADTPAIQADADKTTWVLNNFLTNAIKYSYSGGEIEVAATRQNGLVIFSVKDHGAGIDAAFVPRLFERYFQVPGSREKGTGLGLAISKEFIEAQQGHIWAESEVGKGSAFMFSLPYSKSS